MTDERQGAKLWTALGALPRGSGVVFRHHATAPDERAAVLAQVRRIARRRGLEVGVETISGDGAVRVLLAGQNHWIGRVHSWREAVAARRGGATAIFVSPVFPTRTHPGAATLGPLRAAAIARASGLPAIALGGMTSHRFAHLRKAGFYGWAAIDALTLGRCQKRKAVPI